MTYPNGPLQRELHNAHRSRRMVRASAAVSATFPDPNTGTPGALASANALSIARMALRHLFPGLGKTASASVWKIQNIFLRYSTTADTSYAALRQGDGLTWRRATQGRSALELILGLSPYGRVLFP